MVAPAATASLHEGLQQALGAEAILAVQDATGLPNGAQWDAFFSALDKDQGPTAYLFRCRHCGVVGGYQDCD